MGGGVLFPLLHQYKPFAQRFGYGLSSHAIHVGKDHEHKVQVVHIDIQRIEDVVTPRSPDGSLAESPDGNAAPVNELTLVSSDLPMTSTEHSTSPPALPLSLSLLTLQPRYW